MIDLQITCPSKDIGFVEDKRSFCVEGKIISCDTIPSNCLLTINLYGSNNKIVRKVTCDKKYKDIFCFHPDLITYKDELDVGRKQMNNYGFPPLVVDDINSPYESLNNGSIKAWYSDTDFKAIIINASNKESGALFDDGMNYKDENNISYNVLPMGNYTIEVLLERNNELIGKTTKDIVIGKRSKQLIGRFNPTSHKERLIDWCKNNGVSIITDLLPGYLNPYLGKWFYHMGLLKMYNANDLCLFIDADICLFDYLIDESSTSYKVELAYLQSTSKMNRVSTYYYDIGEAEINGRKAKTLKFNEDEYGAICRIDVLNNKNSENIYYLDNRNVEETIFDLNNICIKKGSDIAIMGVIKPIQLNPNDFVLKDDNTYDVLDYVDTIRYTINGISFDRKANMERIDDYSIGSSVYEFYNGFNIQEDCDINIKCLYSKGVSVDIGSIKIKVE